MGAGLEALHAHGIVHRDVGPRNILYRRSGGREQVLIGDLGIAKDLRWASGLTQPAGTAATGRPSRPWSPPTSARRPTFTPLP